MKVLYFHQHFSTPKGSIGNRSFWMSKQLIKSGHKVCIVCGRAAGSDSGLTGNFVNGLFHGEGKLYDCEGYFIQRGYFENGVLVENNIAIADIVEYDENNPEIPYAEAYISTDVENNNISNNSIYQEYRTSSYIF